MKKPFMRDTLISRGAKTIKVQPDKAKIKKFDMKKKTLADNIK